MGGWTLARIATVLLFGGLVAIMCAGYAGSEALLGAALLVASLGFVLLVVRVLRK